MTALLESHVDERNEQGRRRKAAMIVRMMQNAGEALPLASLPEDVQMCLARELGSLPPVNRDELLSVAEEFSAELSAMALTATRGVKGALEALEGQLSPAVAARAAEEAARGDPEHAWSRLCALKDDKLAEIMQLESLEIATILMSKLPVAKAAKVMMLLPGDRARAIALTTAETENTPRAALANIAHALFDDYCVAPPAGFEAGPVDRVGAILNSTRAGRRDEVLDELDDAAPDFAAKVRKAIFTFADIPHRIEPLDVPKITRDIEQEQLALALAFGQRNGGDEAEATTFILGNLSKRMAEQIRETVQELGDFKASSGEEAQSELVQAIRNATDAGEITQITPETED